MNNIDEILTRGVVNIIPGKRPLSELLESATKLNIYHGIDPTATKIHLGHAVSLRKLQALAEMGHHVTFLIGDFTALIGDTSDKDAERPVLTYEQIEENFKTYKKQAEKILNFSKIKVVHNSEWLKLLKFADIIKLAQHFSVGDFISRELIRKRLDDGSRVGLHEFLYPVMQGYDSFHLDTDLQIGGADQTFNMQAGRTLMKDLAGRESFVLATDYLIGTDGRKMSKSWGNAIWLDDEPNEMFGKVMSLRDNLIIQYFTLATNIPLTDIAEKEKRIKKGENPMNLKEELAEVIVTELYSSKIAQKAKENFISTFRNKNASGEHMQEIKLPYELLSIIDLLTETGLAATKTQAKRLLTGGAIEINGEVVINPKTAVDLTGKAVLIKVGKKKFAKITQI
jgi:tyrosyl-tRNA synthetase